MVLMRSTVFTGKNAENMKVEKRNRPDYLKPITIKRADKKKPVEEKKNPASRAKASIPKVESEKNASSVQQKVSSRRQKRSRSRSEKSKKRGSISPRKVSDPLPRIPPLYDASDELKVDEELQKLEVIFNIRYGIKPTRTDFLRQLLELPLIDTSIKSY